MNGVPLEQETAGEHQTSLFDPPHCIPPSWWAPLPESLDEDTTVFEVDFPAAKVSATFRQLFAKRAVRVAEPSDGVLRAGQPLTLEWSVASDRFGEFTNLMLLSADGALLTRGDSFAFLDAEEERERLRYEAGRLQATVPSEVQFEGAAKLRFWADVTAEVVQCEGVARCGARPASKDSFDLAVTTGK